MFRNFVCSANLGMRFDLTNLMVKSLRRAELVPKKNCILMKLQNPKATAMLFANGKLVCTGAEAEEGIKNAARRFTQVIQKMDFPGVNLIDFKIQNVVGTCDLGFRVLMEALAFAHIFALMQYEPELYPALIYRLEKPQVKILVFVSGKVVFTDSKEPRELYAACETIFPILCQFKDLKPINLGSTDGNKNLPEHRLATDAADKSHIGD
uniref:TATA-box-binding protein n=1 Tax=Hyaloperonospora arabidopsidis (strain Emoy2) TaxID=559515 RepID=M4BN50_HYAAE